MAEPFSIDDVRCLRETEKALLCEIEGEEVWLPKSQVHEDSEVFDAEEHSEGTLVVTAWLAEKQGWL